MADYKLARFKSKEYPYFYGTVKRGDTNVRYWSDTPKSTILKAAREKAKKAGTIPVYAETTKSLGNKLYEETMAGGNKVYYGRIGRSAKRKNTETGKMENYTKQYQTGHKKTLEEAKTALTELEKKHPRTIGGADSPDELLRKHLKELPKGSTINRKALQSEYFGDAKWGISRIGRVLKEFKNKKFNIEGTGPVLRTGETRLKFTQAERDVLNKTFSKEYGGLKGQKLYKAMAAAGESKKARQILYDWREGQYTGRGSGSAAKDAVIKQLNKLKKLPWIRRWFKEGNFTTDSVEKAARKVGNAIKTKVPLPRGQTWLSIGARRLADLAGALTGDKEYITMSTMDKGVLKGATRVVDQTKSNVFQDFGTPFKRQLHTKDFQRQIDKPGGWLSTIKQGITRKLRPQHQVDMVKNLASAAKAGTGGYSVFWQGIRKDINRPLKAQVDTGMEEAEFKLRNIGHNSKVYTNPKTGVTETREQIRDTYNKKVRSFLREANKDVKPGEPVVRALEMTLDTPPSESIARYGEMSDIMKTNVDKAWKDHGYGFKVPKDLLFPDEMKAAVKDPSILENIWKLGRKAPRVLGIPLAIGAGLYTLGRSDPLQAAEIEKISDQGTVVDDQVTEVAQAGTTDQMRYNATTGQFDDAEGEPETQEGILNWIADNPIKSGLAPIPLGMGAGLGAEAMGARNLAKFFTSMKFMLPPAYAAEKLYQYKEGQDLGEMFTNPLDAVWAMALDTPYSAAQKMKYYKEAGDRLGLKHLDPRKWRETGAALKRATMAPASRGTRLVFPFGTEKFGFGAAKPLAKTGLPRALGIGARMLPLGPIPMALVAGSMAWDKYKFNQKVGDHVDALRAEGVVSEEDAETMETIYKQGWLGTTALGAKLLGSEELMFEGEMRDLDYQKMMLDQMKEFYQGREEVATKERVGDRQEDFFSWFSKGGRVGVAEGGDDFKPKGGMTRRTFLKWLVGSIAAGVAAVTGKGVKQAAKTATTTATKSIPTKFAGVEGMPAWFPRAVAKIKAHGKLIEMADKHYVGGDIYEMMIPVQKYYSKGPRGEGTQIKTEMEKVVMEENPLTGEISMHWTGSDNFGDDAVRQINFRPGSAGYQKFGVDPDHPQAWEYQRVKVEDPEFSYSQPDQSQPYREDVEYLDISTEGDEVVAGLEKMTGGVTKEGTVVDDAFKKRIYKDLDQDEALVPDPEGQLGPEGDWLGDPPNEMIEGDVPDWVPKDEWPKKAEGGIIETGNIARRPGAVPPLSGPDPEGIMTLYSNPKQVKVG